MIPDESELLSTKIYGFHKHSLRRGGDTEALPPLKIKANHSSMEKEDKLSRVNMFSVVDRRVSDDLSTADACEQVYLLNTLRKKIKLKVSDRAKINSIKLPKSCLLYTSPSPRDLSTSRMPSSA